MTVLEYREDLKRNARAGDIPDQLISTYAKIIASIREHEWENAHEYLDYFLFEGRIIYELYRQWRPLIGKCFADLGVPDDEFDGIFEELKILVNHPYGPEPFDEEREWMALMILKAQIHRILEPTPSESIKKVDVLREKWRSIHDRQADIISGLMTVISRRFGEEQIHVLYRDYLVPMHFNWRYKQFNPRVTSWEKTLPMNLYLSIESMRGHLCGPKRQGDVEFEEEGDRWVISFDPCGSGQRGMRGETAEGTGSRMEAPYYFAVTQEEHDWAWNLKGICHYCVHCCEILEKKPVQEFGYPVRVVDPPQYPNADAKCRWYIYKDPDKVPEKYYKRIGEKKPKNKLKK